MVTGSLDPWHVRNTATSHLDCFVYEDAVDPLHGLGRAVRVLATARGNRECIRISARKCSPSWPVGLLVDVAGNDDWRTALGSTRDDLVDVLAPFSCFEIEVDAAECEPGATQLECCQCDASLMQAALASEQDIGGLEYPHLQCRKQQ